MSLSLSPLSPSVWEPPPPHSTYLHTGGLSCFWRIHVRQAFKFSLRVVFSEESTDSLRVDICGPLKLASAFPLSSFLSVLHRPSVQSPKSFTLPLSFFCWSLRFQYLEHFPQEAAVLILFVSSSSLKAQFKSHLLYNGHIVICLLWARCSIRPVCFFFLPEFKIIL